MQKNKSSKNLEEANIFFEDRTNKKIDKEKMLNCDEGFDKYVVAYKI